MQKINDENQKYDEKHFFFCILIFFRGPSWTFIKFCIKGSITLKYPWNATG